MKKLSKRDWAVEIVLCALLVAGAGATAEVACGGAQATAASAAYLAEQLACVDQAQTRDEATACRNRVKARWAASPDGGAP